MLLQLNPTVPMTCPKGNGQALFVIDYGSEHNLMWVIALDDSGEIWTYSNQEVRAQKNVTMGRLVEKDKYRVIDKNITFKEVERIFSNGEPNVRSRYKARRLGFYDGVYIYWNAEFDRLCFVNKRENIGVDYICFYDNNTMAEPDANDWLIYRDDLINSAAVKQDVDQIAFADKDLSFGQMIEEFAFSNNDNLKARRERWLPDCYIYKAKCNGVFSLMQSTRTCKSSDYFFCYEDYKAKDWSVFL